MASQTERELFQQNLIEFKLTPRIVHTLYQADVEELLTLGNIASMAAEQYEAKKKFIRVALENGAKLEPGPHDVRLEEISRAEFVSPATSYKKLVIR